VGPGPVWTGAENLAPTGIRSPDRPARSKSLYRLSYWYGLECGGVLEEPENGYSENSNETRGFIQHKKFLEQLREY
jgi:hypothetical protein